MGRPAPAAARTAEVPPALLAIALQTDWRGAQSVLDPAGPDAQRIAGHWWLMLALGTVVFLVVLALFVHAIWWAPRRRPLEEPPVESGDTDDVARRKVQAVGGGAVVTVIILLVVLVQSVRVAAQSTTHRLETPIDIEVIGRQWWWEVHYMAGDSTQRVLSANEIHLPTGRAVRLRLRAADVIHSLWIPNIQGKIDMIPGRENALVLRVDRPGTYRGQCAEFCGLQHAKMALVVVAHAPDDFNRWLAAEAAPALPPTDSLVLAGQQVFLREQCAYCHQVRGTPAAGRIGPDLTHLAARRTIAAAASDNTTGHLAGWILDPHGRKPGTQMPPTTLDGPSLRALLAYLESLR
jgi:cytochrome c oxidase subunit II